MTFSRFAPGAACRALAMVFLLVAAVAAQDVIRISAPHHFWPSGWEPPPPRRLQVSEEARQVRLSRSRSYFAPLFHVFQEFHPFQHILMISEDFPCFLEFACVQAEFPDSELAGSPKPLIFL